MASMSSKRWVVALFVLFALLLLSSYHAEAASTVLAVTPTPTTGAFNLFVPRVGLSTLSSYRATLILTFKGTNAGKPERWTRTYMMLANTEPAFRQMTVDTAGNVDGQVFIAEVNGIRYEQRAIDSCLISDIVQGDSLSANEEPAGFLLRVMGAEHGATKSVNGVAASQYVFNESALGAVDNAKAKGEFWVATEGGYVVKYTLTVKAGADYFGQEIEGTATWDYKLSDINKPLAIKLPKSCPSGQVDAPLVPDATEIISLPGLLTYNSVSSVADIAAFYQKELTTLGWKQSSITSITETQAFLDFAQGKQHIVVVINSDDSIRNIAITKPV